MSMEKARDPEETPAATAETNDGDSVDNNNDRPTRTASAEAPSGFKLVLVLGSMMLGVFLVGLDMTMLSTVVPKLTDYFGSIDDVSWYETSYVLAVCVFIPLVGKIYSILPNKHVYLAFMAIFLAGSLICALSKSSGIFILGRTVNGVGSAGLLSGALLVIFSACSPNIRPLVTSFAMSLLSIGTITGPQIAGVLTQSVTWRWCFWVFLPIGGTIFCVTLIVPIPEQSRKPPLAEAVVDLHIKIDPVGFVIFAGAASMFLLAINWGGGAFSWSSPTVIGLLCGSVAVAVVFTFWIRRAGENALIPVSSVRRRAVAVGSVVMFLQGGSTQAIPYYLPFWFQSVRGDSPIVSALHMLPSLLSNVVALITFGALVRKLHYIPPWAMAGSVLAAIGAGLLSTLSPSTSVGRWVGYQIITTIGRGMAFQVPVVAVQEYVPAEESATGLAVINLFMNLGSAIAVSACQTIFISCLPGFLARYAPDVDVNTIRNAGARDVRNLVSPDQLPGFLVAYSGALTRIFLYPAACAAAACIVGYWLGWERIPVEDGKNSSEPPSATRPSLPPSEIESQPA